MALLDKFAMKLASDLEKQSSENATVDIKMDRIGEYGNKTVAWNIFNPLKFYQFIVVTLSYERKLWVFKVFYFCLSLVFVGMKVMVKDANKFSTDVEYPQSSEQSNERSARIRLPQELFAKYKG